MPTSIVLDETQVQELARLSEREKQPIESIVREAIDVFLRTKGKDDKGGGEAFDAGFGLWGKGEDGLVYQERLRSEW